jgi:hypothetical protein
MLKPVIFFVLVHVSKSTPKFPRQSAELTFFVSVLRRVTSADRAKCMSLGLHHVPDSLSLCAWLMRGFSSDTVTAEQTGYHPVSKKQVAVTHYTWLEFLILNSKSISCLHPFKDSLLPDPYTQDCLRPSHLAYIMNFVWLIGWVTPLFDFSNNNTQ